MDHQAYLMHLLYYLGVLLEYIPECGPEHYDRLMDEVARVRKRMVQIEQMTKTERQQKVRFMEVHITSCINED